MTEQASSIKDLFYTKKTVFLKYKVSKATNELTQIRFILPTRKASDIINILMAGLCLKPFSFLSILFYSPLAYVDPLHCDMTHLFVELLKDSLAEYSYDADIAELNYKLETTVYGIYVS